MHSLSKVAFSVLTQCPLFKNEFFSLQKVMWWGFFSEFYPSMAFPGAIIFHHNVTWQSSRKPAVAMQQIFMVTIAKHSCKSTKLGVYILEYMVQNNFKGTKCSSCDRLDQTQARFCEEGFPFEALSIFNPHSYLQNPVRKRNWRCSGQTTNVKISCIGKRKSILTIPDTISVAWLNFLWCFVVFVSSCLVGKGLFCRFCILCQ